MHLKRSITFPFTLLLPVPLHPGHFSNPLLLQHEHIRTVFVPGFGRVTFLSSVVTVVYAQQVVQKTSTRADNNVFPSSTTMRQPGLLDDAGAGDDNGVASRQRRGGDH
eukprot:CAMPEP_0119220392 /NCGR_PEP_ID=MMETSP1327-20130426/25742_1 /TAXON_ID=38833 /ORGANISM="Micromonas pusilla, Strain RCC2306" /LENGTH=107 /DNA_ID=CAMNT_0007218507 /DNA_START=150 /DNA_END=469 /DNA_ORIENTATION=+